MASDSIATATATPLCVFRGDSHIATFAPNTLAEDVLTHPHVQLDAGAGVARIAHSLIQRGAASPAEAIIYCSGPVPGGEYEEVMDRDRTGQ